MYIRTKYYLNVQVTLGLIWCQADEWLDSKSVRKYNIDIEYLNMTG